MPALPLTPAKLADAARLKSWYQRWKAHQRAEGEPASQEIVASLMGYENQSTVNQYLNGRIPLNITALSKFADIFGCRPEDISPDLALEIQRIAKTGSSHIADAGEDAFLPTALEPSNESPHSSQTGGRRNAKQPMLPKWPFKVRREDIDRLEPADRQDLDLHLARFVSGRLAFYEVAELRAKYEGVSEPARLAEAIKETQRQMEDYLRRVQAQEDAHDGQKKRA